MPDWLTRAAVLDPALDIPTLALRQGVALALGCIVALVYRLTRARPGPPDASLSATLVLLTVLIGMVCSVIGDNVARAFALVGALSIVRFRTVVEDTRDTAFVIFAVAVGMAVGAGYFAVAAVGIPFVAAAAMLFRPAALAPSAGSEPAAGDWSLRLRLGLGFSDETALGDVLRLHTSGSLLTGASTARQGSATERTYTLRLGSAGSVALLVDALNSVPGVALVDVQRISEQGR